MPDTVRLARMFQAGRPISGNDSSPTRVATIRPRNTRSRRGKCRPVWRKWRLNCRAARQCRYMKM
ncbi:hypothetical protein D3C81_1278050 [compost metagenome]